MDSLRHAIQAKLACQQAKFPEVATENDYYLAVAYAVRDHLLSNWVKAARTFLERESRTVTYLSAEYLMGPQLGKNLMYLGMTDSVREALGQLGISLERLIEHEEEPGLGNGGLGRLAACFMDSLATLEIPAIGYGIRYEHGIFDQEIHDGQQVEVTDRWLRLGYPWEIARPEILLPVGFGGRTVPYTDELGRYRVRWEPDFVVNGMAYDTPLLGYATHNANFLRLWHAVAPQAFDFQAFDAGDYNRAVDDKIRSETITKVLYPNDSGIEGKRLRLQQQYLLVSCSLQDMLRLAFQRGLGVRVFKEKFAVQLNDTHPAVAVAELMRLLIDEYTVPWDEAWEITRTSLSYTNHTLLPEALETWSVPLFGSLLPRHLQIIFEINERFMKGVRERYPEDVERQRRLSLIDESGDKAVRMANLAVVGSHAVNGVAELHSKLLRETVLHDFAELYPDRFCNVTNGITPRRFVGLANPGLTDLLTDAIGDNWLKDLDSLRTLEPKADDPAFVAAFREVKQANKARLAAYVSSRLGLPMDVTSLFSVQVKRIHEYKRQLLNLLHVITLYERLRSGRPPNKPRTFIFAGKAAPGYSMAKLIVRLIHDVADTIRKDARAREWLSVVFVPDFNVKVAEHIYPAADLSEQISLAGKEASGTGNMKLSLNGALTIGTLDGANVEIRERVGEGQFYLFGMNAQEVAELRQRGYRPRAVAEANPELATALGLIASGHFSGGDQGRYAAIVNGLWEQDPFMLLADYQSYVDTQERACVDFAEQKAWDRRAVLTVARMGYFSSDRSIRDYCTRIWRVAPVPISAPPPIGRL